MESEQGQEYSRLQGEVIVRLRHHAYAAGRPALHVFQYLILPSFTPPVAWDVFRRARRGHADEFVLARTSWRSDLDLEKLQTPVERLRHPYPLKPTVELHLLPAPSAELEGLARGLALLSLPVGASPGVFGIDGTTYEVAVEQPPHDSPFAARCRLSWWEETPPGWEGLREWIVRAERVFETAWSMRGDAADARTD